MMYLQTYESWSDNKLDGFVVNGFYFAGGFKEYMFLKLSDEDLEKLDKIISNISEKYKDDLYIPIVGTWSFGYFSVKWGVWIPSYMFQVPCKTKEGAIKVDEELVNGFKSFIDNPVCIAIAGGDIAINYDDPFNCDGSAYVTSGRYIDNLKNCQNMIKKRISTIVL